MIPVEVRKAFQDYCLKQGKSHEIKNLRSIIGGSINTAHCIETYDHLYFLKYNNAKAHPQMFSSEFKGLKLLEQSNSLRIPQPLFYYEGDSYSFLLMEYIEQKTQVLDFWEKFAQQLSLMHQVSNESFGLDFDNYMGSLPQSNQQHQTFPQFFINQRLIPQIKKARDLGFLTKNQVQQSERLFLALPSIFPTEKPALVHGDLWSGNFMNDEKGSPVIMDPAVYFGHREVDIAMSTMFGGFSSAFYEAYHADFPMERKWESRLPYYNLYPILIHINLFGFSYLDSFQKVLKPF